MTEYFKNLLTPHINNTIIKIKSLWFLPRNGENMKNFLSLLEIPVFSGLSEQEIEKLCNCLNAHEKKIRKDSFVLHAGDKVKNIYLILSGSMHIINEDFWGNCSIIETMTKHTLFGEAYVLSNAKRHLVSVIAAEASVILVIDPVKLFEECSCQCTCHSKLIKNTMEILAQKIVVITEKLGHIVMRTTDEKVLSYLSKYAKQEKKNSFYIPYSRQQLADYLCVERSALSHELIKLKKNGLINYNRNYFELLK